MQREELAREIRDARQRQRLTQRQLAERSGVSRVTIARLEGGVRRDVRAGTVERLCQALGLEMGPRPLASQARLERLLARERERTRRAERRRDHAVLAARLLVAPPSEARKLLARARAAVDRWERDRLCSRHYITRWRGQLTGPVQQVAQALLEPDDWTDALFQNSPWSFALQDAEA